ncbi:hypothetical protein IEQ34_013187 [Dendrobium chrysotoxum]|uniref:Beta-glucosidase n=1 Tax=Dendrobium chrysotoxum TaxID=161865 RepID=A0AAV7GNK5_DENCH|nr:hypothetical protein IEQ34_013187 [Dendrobium chrysotoxum]
MEFRAVMRTNHHLLILLIILFFSLVGGIAAVARGGELRRKDFPGDFIFGTASSAYQVRFRGRK